MIKELWNVGLKVTDLDREVAFLREVGASLVLREPVSMVGEEREYAILTLGGVRMLLFETVVFENPVSGGVRPGLTHAVYEVDELDPEYARIGALGAEVLVDPTEVSAAFGRRRLAFFLVAQRFRLRGDAGAGTKDLTPVGDQEARLCRSASHSEVGADFKQDVWLEWIAEYISARVARRRACGGRLKRAEMRRYRVTPNARSPVDSGCSLRAPNRSAVRPTEASKASVCYVRSTSILLKNSEIEALRKSRLPAHSVVYASGCHSKAYERVARGKTGHSAEPLEAG